MFSTNTDAGTTCEGWFEDEEECDEAIVSDVAFSSEAVSILVERRSLNSGFSSGCAWGAESGSSRSSRGVEEAAGVLRRPRFSATSTNPAGTTTTSSLSSTSVVSPSSSAAAVCFRLFPKCEYEGFR